MFKNIMVAFDGSDLSKQAINIGEELAIQGDAKLHVFHTNVVSAYLSLQAQAVDSLKELLDNSGERVRIQAEELLEGGKANYEVVVVSGTSPEKEINNYIRKNDIDLLVIGSRGVGTIKQYFGSVAHAVLNTTRIPVMIIKPKD